MCCFGPIVEITGHEFSLADLEYFRTFALRFDAVYPGWGRVHLEIDALYGKDYFICLEFRGIRLLRMAEVEGIGMHFGTPHVLPAAQYPPEQLDEHQRKGLAYAIVDDEEYLEFYCEDIRVLRISRLNPDGSETVLWRRPDDAPKTDTEFRSPCDDGHDPFGD